MDEAYASDLGGTGSTTTSTPGGPVEKTEGAVKRLILAGVGAAATACDTAAEQFDQFVDRGERVQEEWQTRADDVRRQNAGARMRFRDSLRNAMDVFLNGLNVPSKGDIETINVKLNILSRKLDDLQMDHVRGASATEPGPPSPPPPSLTL